jgi:outer membrane protein, heavy metal efflux system
MISKTTACSSLALLLWAGSAAAAPPLDQRALVQKACRAPAEQSRARAERAIASAERASAGVAPNPRLEAQHLRTLDGPKDRETIVGLAVPFVVSGRRGLLRDAAGARGREAEASVRAARFEALIAAQRLFASAVIEQERQAVLARQQSALDDLAAAVAKLARGGETARHDALRQSLEARAHRHSLARTRARAAAARSALEAWLGEPVTLPALEQSGLAGPRALSAGAAEHPQLASLRASARASELEAQAARRRSIPDPELFAGYRQLDVEGATGRGIALGLSVPLPLFDHGQGEARRAEAQALRARAEHAAEKRRLDTTSRAELGRLRVLEAELGRDEQNARDAGELRDGARKLYAAGEASVVEVLDAYRAAEAAELSQIDTIEELALARIELKRAIGGGLERACDKEAP